MSKKIIYLLISMLMIGSLVMSACAPAPEPVEEVEEVEVAEEPEEAEEVEEAEEAAEPTQLWTKPLRQAFAAAIDREVIVDRVFEGRNIPAYHMVPEGYPYATEPFLDKYGTRDLDLAIELLTGEGYTADAPFEFDLWYPPEHYGTTTADVMQVIKEQVEETGLMKVNLVSQNWAEYVDSFVAGNYRSLSWAGSRTLLTPKTGCHRLRLASVPQTTACSTATK